MKIHTLILTRNSSSISFFKTVVAENTGDVRENLNFLNHESRFRWINSHSSWQKETKSWKLELSFIILSSHNKIIHYAGKAMKTYIRYLKVERSTSIYKFSWSIICKQFNPIQISKERGFIIGHRMSIICIYEGSNNLQNRRRINPSTYYTAVQVCNILFQKWSQTFSSLFTTLPVASCSTTSKEKILLQDAYE